MSISTEITRLQTAKADIKTAIENKGVSVPSSEKLDNYDYYIDQITTGTPIATFTITSQATKSSYFTGETTDYTGITFRVVYENGAILDLTKSDVTFSPAEGTTLTAAGTTTVSCAFETATVTFNISVTQLAITSFVVTSNPTKVKYKPNEALDYTGATFRATWNNGTVENLSKTQVTFAPVEGTVLTTEQTYTITVTYLTATTTFTVTCQSLEIVTWANGTDAQIMAMINADRNGDIDLRDYWAVGDTRTITLSAMSATEVGESHAQQSVSMVLMDSTCTGFTYTSATASGRTTPRFMVGQRHCLNEKGYMNSSNTNSGGWMNSARRTWCNSVYYNAVPSTIREAFKQFTWKQGKGGSASSGLNTTQDYFALPPEKAIFGSVSYSYSDEGALYSQWTHYQTSSNRIKNVNGSAYYWWECSPYSSYSLAFCIVGSDGSAHYSSASFTYGLAPFGVI